MTSVPGQPIWVGVDVGTQSVRAVAVADDGTVLARAAFPLTSVRVGGRHTQDPAQWWSAACASLRTVTTGIDPDRVAAVSVSATSGTIVVVDREGHPVTPGLMYDDPGGAPWVDEVSAVGGSIWTRLGYRMQATWALPEILALVDAGEIPAHGRVLHQPDLITSRLAGDLLASDSSHALKTGFDLDTMAWPADVMAALRVDPAILPAVVASGTVIGQVAAAGAAATGLPVGCAIVAGMTDGCAAQIGAGALRPGDWNSVLGTTLVLKGVSPDRHRDPGGTVYPHLAPFGAGWFPGGASSTGAGAVSTWLPGADLARYTDEVARSTRVPVAYPLVGTGERFPFAAPAAHHFFDTGDAVPAAGPDLLSDIAHGVAYVERLGFDLIRSCGYDTSGVLTFTGGGTRNAWWNQLRCDLLDHPVQVPGDGDGAIGMAVLAAAALDEQTPGPLRLARAADRMLDEGPTLTPDTGRGDQLRTGYARFLDRLHRETWLPDDLFDHARGAS